MQVATVPKSAGGQSVQLAAGQGQRIVQAAQVKTSIPQGATIVKLVNAQGQPGKIIEIRNFKRTPQIRETRIKKHICKCGLSRFWFHPTHIFQSTRVSLKSELCF